MPRFNELSSKAKAYARKEFVESPDYPHDGWWVFDDFIECAKCMGIQIKAEDIYFSGFWSQGDGASFEGTYKCEPNAVAKIKAHAPLDQELHRIAEELTIAQVSSKFLDGGSLMGATITTSRSRYTHSGTMECDIQWTTNEGDQYEGLTGDELIHPFRAFADWIYSQLEKQHEYYYSNEYIDEYLNEYEFDEEGSII